MFFFYFTDTPIIYQCTYPGCCRTFQKQVWCNKHLATHFTNHICPTCNKVLSSKSTLNRHLQIHVDKRKTLKCTSCEHSFFFQSDLKYHEKTAHSEGNLFRCTDCEKQYSTQKLFQHQ